MLVLAAMAAGGLAACGGGSGDGGGETAVTASKDVMEGVGAQLEATTTTGAPVAAPTSMADWEALWAEERAAIVQRIKTEKLGVSADGKTLTGPEGYQIDLSKCPPDWSETQGLTDTEIKMGWAAPLSGAQADFGGIPKGATAVLEEYSKQGVFKDSAGKTRKVNMVTRDDSYDPAKTIPLVDELMDSEKVFALLVMISPGGLSTYDKTNQRCMPQMITTGHPAWGDPVNHPWTTGHILSYSTEAVLWGSYIQQNLAKWGGKATVAGLVMSNDFGKAYEGAFKGYLKQAGIEDKVTFVTEVIEPQAPTVKDQMTTLGSRNPDVFIAMTTGTSCTQSITEASENGMKERLKAAFLPSVCKASSFLAKDKVGGDGMASDGWWVVGGGLKDFNGAAFDNDPWVKWAREVLGKAGYDYKSSGNLTWGASLGWQITQALLIAGELPGGLTRANLNLAWRSMDMSSPALVEGVKFNMNGNKDAFLIEGADLSQWNAAQQKWEVRNIVELSGKSGLCAWSTSTRSCG